MTEYKRTVWPRGEYTVRVGRAKIVNFAKGGFGIGLGLVGTSGALDGVWADILLPVDHANKAWAAGGKRLVNAIAAAGGRPNADDPLFGPDDLKGVECLVGLVVGTDQNGQERNELRSVKPLNAHPDVVPKLSTDLDDSVPF